MKHEPWHVRSGSALAEVILGASYYQLLTIPLFALALGTAISRSRTPSARAA